MKKIILMAACALLVTTACNNASKETESETKATEQKDGEVKVEGKDGGSVEVNKEGVSISGKDGGSLKVDENGVEIKGKDGGGVTVGNTEEKK